MKISYALQLKDFTIMLLLGVILGIIYGLLNFHSKIKLVFALQIISDLIFSLIAFGIFTLAINKINYGEIRLFLFSGYILGFIIERRTLGKLFAKGYKRVYTNLVKTYTKFSNSKLGRIIFK